ncbi:transaldolase family protein [Sunxiuqinia elliptica]|uniref:Fructose-6-phosphate aldolase 2 n=2 Tax=Sunxiuqinia elliptica TaxID=655355 RepID=A0A1I2EJA3_9BACT|nr:transaldolase family protein [Sunxiuqinia elliptica]TDO04764.1 fructose-6-phosphate aldolase 2 [Sunxiuqinia elliptica]TDO64311.1 fructose-6-phosphate aldolase 2 [Sunxiuqinia elliptica]SFE92717.1 fructose-6-phosphate aldolase 2 [Sunxiuqinia elliptica]
MIYMADTADLSALKELYDFFPLEGVTTNPTILKLSGMKLSAAVDELKKIVGEGMLHVQVMSQTCEDIVREAKKYKSYFDLGDNFYAKIPVMPEGFKAMRILKDSGIKVTATAIFTQQQALVASKAGADFVAPYVSRLDNISSHGIEVVSDIVKNMKEYGLNTKVLAASFKTVDQIHRVSMHGSHSATIGPDLLMQLIKHPMTDISIDKFTEDGEGLYDIEF